MAFGIEDFKISTRGQMIGEILQAPKTVEAMITVSRHGLPPAQEVGQRLVDQEVTLSDEEKRLVGRWIREIMEENGWTTDGVSKKRVAPDSLFRTGAVYHRKGETSRRS